jgi:hypothetical protein
MDQLIPGVFEAVVEQFYVSKVWRRPEVATVEDLVLARTNEQMKQRLKAFTAAQNLIDEIVLSASDLYDRAPAYVERELSRAVEFTLLLRSEGTGDDEGGATPKSKALGPFRIADRMSVTDVFKLIRLAAVEKGVVLDLPLTTLHAYFNTVVGRTVAIDGALMNFGELVPDSMMLTIG